MSAVAAPFKILWHISPHFIYVWVGTFLAGAVSSKHPEEHSGEFGSLPAPLRLYAICLFLLNRNFFTRAMSFLA